MNHIKHCGMALALALVGSFSVPAAACEQGYDNFFPTGEFPTTIPASFFTPKAHQWSVPEEICGQDVYGYWDADYTLLSIPTPFAGCNNLYSWISFDHSQGDLDMAVYDLAGNMLGISQGVTNQESVYLGSSAPKTVIVKVYGYNHATGAYRIYTGCQ
jgi:hypothetical protein